MSTKTATRQKKVQQPSYVAKRGRPSIKQAVALGDHILHKAQALFLLNGYAQTSMEAVAAAAGVSKGTLYARYPGKADLFRAIVAERQHVWSAIIPKGTESPSANLSEYLYRRGVAMLDAMGTPEIRAFCHLVVSESRRFPELVEDFQKNSYDLLITEISEEIERHAKADGWPTVDAKGVATIFVNSLQGWWLYHSHLDELPRETYKKYTARLVLLLSSGRTAW